MSLRRPLVLYIVSSDKEDAPMPKYLLHVSYTAEGAKGVLKEGGTARQQAARRLVESVGGKLECMYFAFGETDVFAIADLPDNMAAAAAAMAISATGALHSKTTVLLTCEEVDQATRRSTSYTPPGRS